MDRIDAANELSFRVGFSGHSGHLRIEPLPPVERSDPLKSLPDFILPPAFPEETSESIKEHIEETFLSPRLDSDEFSPVKAGRQWQFDWFDRVKVHPDPSVPRYVVVPQWELPFRRPKKGDCGQWEPSSVEVEVSQLMVGDEVYGSMLRSNGPSKDFVRGSINNRPFRPGGLETSQPWERIIPVGASDGGWVQEVLKGGPAQSVPPGFKKEIRFGNLEGYSCSWNVYKEQRAPTSTKKDTSSEFSVQFDDLFKKAWEEDAVAAFEEDGHQSDSESTVLQDEASEVKPVDCIDETGSSVLDKILSVESRAAVSAVNNAGDGAEKLKEEWAVRSGGQGIADHFHELVPDLALDFPFELDTFQKEAIYCVERGESVFVAAHTSAGKTVVAEYAFALASKHCTRAVYTAPIKTISNQKYRDFCGKFDVGLLTGDVSLRPDASCLIMTTEILRSMLYRGADIIRDIEWVIFDEVHYVNDVERGVVWEEVIIMLPRHINIILLSATVPNTLEFAGWIGQTKLKKIIVTETKKRPVPLEHCLFYSGELYKICENETFMSHGLKAAKDVHKKKNLSATGGTGFYSGSARGGAQNQRQDNHTRGQQNKHPGSHNSGNVYGTKGGAEKSGAQSNWISRRSEASIWMLLINNLSKKSFLPVVIFCFSKNRCDKSADNLTGIDLTTSSEKSSVRLFCDKAFSRLKGSDRNLPQVVRVQSLLHRGIGVHHAGLLPIVKEVVEMLFCRGVIKVLFSTETFAMGVNAPARTVVFDTLRKFDGKEFRQLLPGEYTQMAGRAGRRGLDKIGTVITMCRDEIPDEIDLKHVIVGSATKLQSQFRLTYIMILHLLRVEELQVQDMLKRSFAEFHAQTKLPEKERLLLMKQSQYLQTIECIKGEPAIEEYYDMYARAEELGNKISEIVMQSSAAHQFLGPGRVVVMKSHPDQDHLLGVVVKPPSQTSKQYIVLLLVPDLPPTTQSQIASKISQDKRVGDFSQGQLLLPKAKRGFEDDYYSSGTSRKGSGVVNIKLPHRGVAAGVSYEVRGVDNGQFLCICTCKMKIDQVGLLEDISTAAYSKTVRELLKLKQSENKYPPALDPLKDLKLKDVDAVKAYHELNILLRKMAENKCHGCVKFEEHIKWAKEAKKYKNELSELKFQMSDDALQQMPDFNGRVDVLTEIGCIDRDLGVQIKGRVACEMNSGEELICTECLFENQLDDLEPEEAVAIMSAFVFQQKNASDPSLTPKLSEARRRLYNTAIGLGELQKKHGVQIDPEEYVMENLKFGLVEVVYEWAKGTPFSDICELTDVPEGLIVRTIVRLDETCREFKNAAAIMGNSALCNKMESASNAIRRDIVFAASLYVTGV